MPNLFLIVLTNSVHQKINSIDTLKDEFEHLGEIKFFKYRSNKDVKEGKTHRIALPSAQGDMILLLKKAKEQNYFLAIDILLDKTTNVQSPDCVVRRSQKCQILQNGSKVNSYKNDSLDHSIITSEVDQLKDWKIFENSNIETRLWNNYFEIYKKLIEQHTHNFKLSEIKESGKYLTGKFSPIAKTDEQSQILENAGNIEDKMRDVINSDISMIISRKTSNKKSNQVKPPKLGRLRAVEDETIQIALDKEFKNFFIDYIKESTITYSDPDSSKSEQIKCEIEEKTSGKKEKQQGVFNVISVEKSLIEFKASFIREENPDEDTNSQPIYLIDKNSITPLSFECTIDWFSETFQLDIMIRCFKQVQKKEIWKVLSGDRVSKLPVKKNDIIFDNTKLNENQKNAIKGALGAEELFLIWGPPGTGKTEVIKEIAKHESIFGNKTLITSQSNLAVDNALGRLKDENSVFSLRVAKKDYTLEGEDIDSFPLPGNEDKYFWSKLSRRIEKNIEKNHEDSDIQQKFLKEVRRRIGNNKTQHNLNRVEEREIKQAQEAYKERINVVGCTLMESGKTRKKIGNASHQKFVNKLLDDLPFEEFDTVIIDEVSKATPPELFIPIAIAKKVILVGDFKQLPPMIKMISGDDKFIDDLAREVGIEKDDLDFDQTIFERLWERHIGDSSPVRAMLTEQYRMHKDIQRLIEPFYNDVEMGRLTCGLSQSDMEELKIKDEFYGRPCMWIGTRTTSLEKKDGSSFYNSDEIEKVGTLLHKLDEIKKENKKITVGVITFYGAQLRKLKEKYEKKYQNKWGKDKIIFGTVDRFQGRECDIVICSLVRNNEQGRLGFAQKPNRINVAFSRARSCLVILGSKDFFAYEAKGREAKNIYKNIYEKCEHPCPQELK